MAEFGPCRYWFKKSRVAKTDFLASEKPGGGGSQFSVHTELGKASGQPVLLTERPTSKKNSPILHRAVLFIWVRFKPCPLFMGLWAENHPGNFVLKFTHTVHWQKPNEATDRRAVCPPAHRHLILFKPTRRQSGTAARQMSSWKTVVPAASGYALGVGQRASV